MKRARNSPAKPRPTSGATALEQLYRGVRQARRPLVFLDIDDVLCLSDPYGGYDVFSTEQQPLDLWERLWHPPAVQTLLAIVEEHHPRIVITSSWLRLMNREGFIDAFRRTGLAAIADALHESWEAPQLSGATRLSAIEAWLHAQYRGEPLVVLDDALSGTGLRGSRLEKAGCVILCETGEGLHAGHLGAIRKALNDSTFRRRIAHRKNLYGNGKASPKICAVLESAADDPIPLTKRFFP